MGPSERRPWVKVSLHTGARDPLMRNIVAMGESLADGSAANAVK